MIFIGEKKLEPSDPVKRIGEPMLCAKAGVSIMTRKDSLEKFAWYDVGLAKLRANGEYDWLCNINSAGELCYFHPLEVVGRHNFKWMKIECGAYHCLWFYNHDNRARVRNDFLSYQ